jgi:hypothetical protein
MKIKWFDEPQEHDYSAAESYLSLVISKKAARKAAAELRSARTRPYAAKDIFRASGLSLLGVSNSHVEKDLEKIARGEKLSPLLLRRDEANGKLIIADGYHRACAVYKFDEDALIPCRIV